MDEELRAAVRLVRAGPLTTDALHTALSRHGSLARWLAAQAPDSDLSERLARVSEAQVDADLRWLEASGAQLISAASPHYPPRLAAWRDAPALLYVWGELEMLARPQVAIVGTRAATPGGRLIARQLARELVAHGIGVTSGLAQGIDAAAHEGALDGAGPTLAVCAHGLDQVYPRVHADLARRIRARGALISELPPRSPPRRARFVQRNRLVSGIACGTLVVEAGSASGALCTARWAREQNRTVMAVPGSIRNPCAAGCHALLKSGATLIECAADVINVLGLSSVPQGLSASASRSASRVDPGRPLDKPSEMLLDALGFEPASVDALVERTGLPSESIASMLLILELEGRVAPHPVGCYCRLS